MKRRVVITGIGSINCVAHNVEDTWQSLLAGKSGIKRIEGFKVDDIRCQIGGEVRGFSPADYNIETKLEKKMDEFQKLIFASAQEAAMSAKMPFRHPEEHDIIFSGFENMKSAVEDPFRQGVMLGVGVGGIKSFEKEMDVLLHKRAKMVSPFLIPKMITNQAVGWLTQSLNCKGINTCYVTACASSTNSIGEAFWAIKADRADLVVTGGAESSACRIGFSGFSNMRALSTRNDEPEKASRPFDKDRDGFVMGEGGTIIMLEELEHAKKRGATIYAEVVGYGITNDAHHMTSPDPSGKGAEQAMKDAMAVAEIGPADIDYINAHGTSTKANDNMETNAIKGAFGKDAYNLCVSSTKSMTGHLLGGAGSLETMVISLATRDNKIPPTINLDNPDEGFDLDYVPHTMRETTVNYAMSNSFGFGGHNTSLIVKKYT